MADGRQHVAELLLTEAAGLWEVSSSGPTRYLLDADAVPPMCMRLPAAGTHSRGRTDNVWAPVVQVRSIAADGAATPGLVRVGERALWDLDAGDEIVWWLQRLVTAIRPIARGGWAGPSDHRSPTGDSPE